MRADPEAVLITGVYGSGKTTVAVEMADVLEKAGFPYAVLDLDWLSWAATGTAEEAEHRMMLRNLTAVVGNYLDVGIRFFVLAGAYMDRGDLDDLRAELPMSLRVVRVTVPWPEIERRLRADITAGRRDDLRDAAAQVAAGEGAGLEDLATANDRPLREVATEILAWLGWA